MDNLTGILGEGSIADDVVARRFCNPLAEIAENGTTMLLIAHSAKNFEAQSGKHTPTGVMGSTVYQAWERLNPHIHDVTEPDTRAVAIRSNGHGDRNLLLRADWGRASAQWSLVKEREDTRQRSEKAHQQRDELFERVAGDTELSRIESMREVGRKLHAAAPDQFASDNAAYMAFSRAKNRSAGCSSTIAGRWPARGGWNSGAPPFINTPRSTRAIARWRRPSSPAGERLSPDPAVPTSEKP